MAPVQFIFTGLGPLRDRRSKLWDGQIRQKEPGFTSRFPFRLRPPSAGSTQIHNIPSIKEMFPALNLITPRKHRCPRLTNSLIGSHHRMMYMPTAVATRSVFIGPFTHWELAIGQTEATPHTNLFISSRPGHAREERLSSRHR